MTAKLLDGEELVQALRADLLTQVDRLKAAGCQPRLVAVEVGEAPASKVYTNSQAKACQAAGIEYQLITLPVDAPEEQALQLIRQLNDDPKVTGIIVQLPLPVSIDARKVQAALSPDKDVEGMHPLNYGRLFGTTGHVAPCTAMAAVEIVRATGIALAGQEVVIVGHSEIVGKPIAMLLLQSPMSAPTVTVCHVATRDLASHTRRADVLFVATGVRQMRWQRYHSRITTREHPPLPDLCPLITAEMVKPGAMVIDVAINRIPAGFDEHGQPVRGENGKLKFVTVGDVDFDRVKDVAGAITPVPGGVGPVTVMMLLRNTLRCALRICKLDK